MIRVGHGYDVHAFGSDKVLKLGGVEFSAHIGLIAHSDGDVLLHAVCDALLGAAALGDIGKHFPDTDNSYAGADSAELLTQVNQLLLDKEFQIGNLDITVIAQTPRMADKIPEIQKRIAQLLSVDLNQVNVKATTTEKLGYIGRKEGIAVHCIALINKGNR
jgi:2-C-methyl-D-erythritol 2,4-cyclodiphosphate synthase